MSSYLLILAVISLWFYGYTVLPTLLSLSTFFVALYAVCSLYVSRNEPPMSTRRKLMMASWEPSQSGTVFGVINCNAEPLVAYMEKLTARGIKVTPTIVAIKALALAFHAAPSINGRIAFGQFLPHATIDIGCLVALDDGKDLANAKIQEADKCSLEEIAKQLRHKAEKLRAHKDSDFESSKPLLKLLPVCVLKYVVYIVGYLSAALGVNIPALGVRPFPFGSAVVTSVGMLGVEQGFVPFTPFVRVPLLIMVGAITKRAVVDNHDKITVQNQLCLTCTLDHRFADGTAAAAMAKKLRYYVEHPEELDNQPAKTSKHSK